MMDPASDQFSDLPIIILHDILSRLPRKDAAMTSMLSKAWRETWYTFPIVSISDSQFIRSCSDYEYLFWRRDMFIEYVKKILMRFIDQGLSIKEFKINMHHFETDSMSRDVDLWLKLACENGVEVLKLCMSNCSNCYGDYSPTWYTLPPLVLQTKSLDKLVLAGRIDVGQTFLNCSIQFFSLRVLSLSSVLLGDERSLKHLISCCPMIEQITLDHCRVYNSLAPSGEGLPISDLKSLSLNGLQKLKAVKVIGIEELHIDAPNLEDLYYCRGNTRRPFKLSFVSCTNLRRLKLSYLKKTVVEDNFFVELFSKFPFLESLKLLHCSVLERIDISYAQLKVLKLYGCKNLKEINIDAPELLSCKYICRGANKPVISFLRSSSHLEISLLIYTYCAMLCDLREFLQNFKPLNILASLSLFIDPYVITKIETNLDLVSSPPPRIKHLVLSTVPTDPYLFFHIMGFLLSSCFPEVISISIHPRIWFYKPFLVYLYKSLVDKCCGYCRFDETKCWWHGMKNVKVTCSWMKDQNVSFATMLKAFPVCSPFRQQNIRFWLKL